MTVVLVLVPTSSECALSATEIDHLAMIAVLGSAHADPRDKQRGLAATVAHGGIHSDPHDFDSMMIPKFIDSANEIVKVSASHKMRER